MSYMIYEIFSHDDEWILDSCQWDFLFQVKLLMFILLPEPVKPDPPATTSLFPRTQSNNADFENQQKVSLIFHAASKSNS